MTPWAGLQTYISVVCLPGGMQLCGDSEFFLFKMLFSIWLSFFLISQSIFLEKETFISYNKEG